jgi:hypothetical protein
VWLRENNKQLRTVSIVFALLVVINPLLYFFLIAPSEAWLKTGEAQSAEFRMRHAEATVFKGQKP